MLFEASRVAFEAGDLRIAAGHASSALIEAIESFAMLTGGKPLLKFIEADEYDEWEKAGDFLRRQPNIVTDARPSDFFPTGTRWQQVIGGPKECWNDFVKWADSVPGNPPLLLAYGRWLALEHGQGELLKAKCDALAARLFRGRE
jgi:hypothetical protein